MEVLKSTLLVFVLGFLSVNGFAQPNKTEPWIAYPTANVTEYGVYHFRKTFELNEIPQNLEIHVSADNRYNLFVNGKRVSYGPAKGDLKTYKYDVIDIAPLLKPGKNVLAALVYNAGEEMPMAFISSQTAFLLRTATEKYSELIDTDDSWKAFENPAYQPVTYAQMIYNDPWFYGYYACGPGDNLDASKYPWGWEELNYDDTKWISAEELTFQDDPPWNLVPRKIAFMADHIEKPARIRRVTGIDDDIVLLKENGVTIIPAHTEATILMDFDVFTMGYPELTLDKGSGSALKLKYAEALYEKVNQKAHRDSVKGKEMNGVWDLFHADGGKRTFRPLWKRAFRYVQLDINTEDQPLHILSFHNEYSGYPYPDMATFHSDDEQLNKIFDMGRQTLRMCSGETYYDTPFYEQLSYGGDNRPIGNLSIYNATDDRLFREVMRLYTQSETRQTGLFKAAYPSRFGSDMGTWSLAWVQSLYDYYYYRGDEAYVKQFIPNIERVLGFFHRHMDESKGILGYVNSWNFMDWSIIKGNILKRGDKDANTHSILLTLFYLHSIDGTVKLYREIGEQERADKWVKEAEKIKKAVKALAWDEERQLFRDYPNSDVFSQHTNILAILTDVIPEDEQPALLDRVLNSDAFKEYASSYFSFFLFKAMEKTGKEDLFLENLGHWYKFLNRGHTTTGETGFDSHDRSDCHAWSAHPTYFLLSLVCGIQPADVGFKTIKIEPHPGDLKTINADMPHPMGRIAVDYKIRNGKIRGTVTLPEGMSGVWQYNDQEIVLEEGTNKIR